MAFGEFTIDSYNVHKKYGIIHSHTLVGADAATAANYSVFFTAPHTLNIVRVIVNYTAASSSGTLQIEALPDGTAPGAGTNILASTIDLASTANTNIERNNIGNKELAVTRLNQGERLALVDGGTLTGLTDLNVTIYFTVAARGDFIL